MRRPETRARGTPLEPRTHSRGREINDEMDESTDGMRDTGGLEEEENGIVVTLVE